MCFTYTDRRWVLLLHSVLSLSLITNSNQSNFIGVLLNCINFVKQLNLSTYFYPMQCKKKPTPVFVCKKQKKCVQVETYAFYPFSAIEGSKRAIDRYPASTEFNRLMYVKCAKFFQFFSKHFLNFICILM